MRPRRTAIILACLLTLGSTLLLPAPVAAQNGTITGTVRDEATGLPLSTVFVFVINGGGSTVGYPQTDASGLYTVSGLAAGNYFIHTRNYLGYVDQVYAGVSCPYGQCAATSGTSVAVSGGETTIIDFALAAGGTISGTVTAANGGVPIPGVTVRAYNGFGAQAGPEVVTDADGRYTTGKLQTGTHFVRTNLASGYVDQLYSGIDCLWNCPAERTGTGVSVTAGNETPGINFSLRARGSITGVVRDAATNLPLAGVTVVTYDTGSGSFISFGQTDAAGVYTVSGLLPTSYYVYTSNAIGYLNQAFDNVPCVGGCSSTGATPVHVPVAGSATANFALVRGGTITGTVSAATGGAPLAGIQIRAFRSNGTQATSEVWTNASGQYTVSGLSTGVHYVRTYNTAATVEQIYSGINCLPSCPAVTTGTGVSVTTGLTTFSIDFSLLGFGSISGRVRSAATNLPLSGVSVYLYNGAGNQVGGGASTNGSGAYAISGLQPGSYFVATRNWQGYEDQLHANVPCPNGDCTKTAGTVVTVASGGNPVVDFALKLYGTISGTVTAAVGGAPLSGIPVRAYTSNGATAGSTVQTDASGQYTITGLATGTHYVRTYHVSGYVDQLYNGIDCLTGCPSVTSGSSVSVTAGAQAPNISFSLLQWGSITGTVRGSDTGLPLSGVDVFVYDSAGSFVRSATTNASGVYTASSLVPTSYFVKTANSLGYLNQLYAGMSCATGCTVTAGTPVVVPSGGSPTADFTLPRGGAISGTVTSANTGAALSGIYIVAYNASGGQAAPNVMTDASGQYTVAGLTTGTFYVRAYYPTDYLDQIYSGINCAATCPAVTTGTGVSVTAGSPTPGVNFSLAARGTITGTVKDAATNLPLSSITLRAYDSGGTLIRSAATSSSGTYTISSLVPGSYFVRTSNWSGYVDQLHAGIPWAISTPPVTTGTAVAVPSGGSATVDFSLAIGGTISGTVTAASGGAPLFGISVRAYNSSDWFVGSSPTTDDSGQFTITGLPTGTFYVRTIGFSSYAEQLYKGITCVTGCPDVFEAAGVSVTAGAPTTGIDFSLLQTGSITGTIRDADTNQPIAGISVEAFYSTGASTGITDTTNASGVYRLPYLPPGSHFVRTSNDHGYEDRLYANILCPGGRCAPTSGTAVSVSPGVATSGIDFALGPYRRYFAEGAATWFFDCEFALVNPSQTTTANVTLRFLRSDGATFTDMLQIPPMTRRTLNARDVPGLAPAPGFSTVIESDVEIVADRTMTWDSSGYGSHAETAIAAPAQTWYLAEGATHSGFDLYYMIENPNPDPIDVQITYLRRAPKPVVTQIYPAIAGYSRTTIYVNAEPDLAWNDVSGVITSLTPDHPIIVERAMYLNSGGTFFNGGTASAGVTAPATDWFLAEGATLNLFDTYIVLANPGDTGGTATLTYMLTDGRTLTKDYPVAAKSRQTVWVNGESGDGIDLSWVSLSTMIHADVPIIAERTMWWPLGGPSTWHEGHNAVATTQSGTLWALADGAQGGIRNTQTYVLVANTSPFAGRVQVTLLGEDGSNPQTEIDVPANSRTTVWMGGTEIGAGTPFGGRVDGKRFGTVVESVPTIGGVARIVVERAMYSDANGVWWAAGTGAVATKLR